MGHYARSTGISLGNKIQSFQVPSQEKMDAPVLNSPFLLFGGTVWGLNRLEMAGPNWQGQSVTQSTVSSANLFWKHP